MRARVVVPLVVVIVAAGVALGLWFARPEVVTDDPVTVPSASPEPSDEPRIAPLTGVEVAEVPDRSVLAVKVENSAAGRPQTGLDSADIVFEQLTEGGITRFIALYQSRLPETVGPVRSARFMDADILPAFDPVFAISGAAPPVDDALAAARLLVVQEGQGFFRGSERRAPHNLYLRPQEVLDSVDGPAPPTDVVWPFETEPPAGGTPGDSLVVPMSDVSVTGWTYESASGLYRREQDGVPFTVTGADHVAAANVVVIAVETAPIPGQDAGGHPLVASDVIGRGRAIVLRDGLHYESGWTKSSAASHFSFTGPDGGPLALKPGPTWVMLAPVELLPAPPPEPSATPTG